MGSSAFSLDFALYVAQFSEFQQPARAKRVGNGENGSLDGRIINPLRHPWRFGKISILINTRLRAMIT